jgi:hypothetical protein
MAYNTAEGPAPDAGRAREVVRPVAAVPAGAVVVLVQDDEARAAPGHVPRRLSRPLRQPEHDVGLRFSTYDAHARVRRQALVQQVSEAPARAAGLAARRIDEDPERRVEAQFWCDAQAARARRGASSRWYGSPLVACDVVRHDEQPRHGEGAEGRPEQCPATTAAPHWHRATIHAP